MQSGRCVHIFEVMSTTSPEIDPLYGTPLLGSKDDAVIYVASREPGGEGVIRRYALIDGVREVGTKIDPRLDLWPHSPTGLNWGYAGSGPAQTALAILADHFGAARALRPPKGGTYREPADAAGARAIRLHQPFKFAVVASAGERWAISSGHIDKLIEKLEAAQPT